MRNDLPSSLSMEDILNCKAFRAKAPSLLVKITTTSFNGVCGPETELEVRTYEELRFALLAGIEESNDMPFLSNTWMEMAACAKDDLSAVSSGNIKHRKKGKRFNSRYHVRTAEIEGANKGTFDVALDGVVYGPFQKVVLSPLAPDISSVAPEYLTFNLMSFLNKEET